MTGRGGPTVAEPPSAAAPHPPPSDAGEGPRGAPTPYERARLRPILLGLSGGSLVLAALACAQDAAGFGALVAWVAAMTLLWLSFRDRCRPYALSTTDWVLLAALSLVAGFFRLYEIHAQPVGLWLDELSAARNALDLADSGQFRPFGATPLSRRDWVQTSNLYLYYCWLVIWASDFTRLGVKLISVIPGVFAAPCVYLFARRLMSRPAAFAVGGWLATSLWHVTLSRWGWDEVLVTTLVVLAFMKLRDGAEHHARSAFLAAGLILGVSLYTYVAARLALAAAGIYLVWNVATGRRRHYAVAALVFLLGVVFAALPIGIYWAQHPSAFTARINELSTFGKLLDGDASDCLASLKAHLLMLHVSGDQNPRHNLPGEPMLEPLAGGLFLLGLLVTLVRWRRSESMLLLCWLAFGLAGGVFSGAAEAPQAYRTGMIAPACLLFSGLGLDAAYGFVSRRIRAIPAALYPITSVLAVAISGAQTYVGYFHTRAACGSCWWSMGAGAPATVAMRMVEKAVAHEREVLVDPSMASGALRFEVDQLLLRRMPQARVGWSATQQWTASDVGRKVLLLSPRRWVDQAQALQACRQAPLTDPFGVVVVAAVCCESDVADVCDLD